MLRPSRQGELERGFYLLRILSRGLTLASRRTLARRLCGSVGGVSVLLELGAPSRVNPPACATRNVSWWHPASKNLLRLEAGYPALRCHILKQNTGHTHNTHNTRTTTQPNTRATKHTTKPLSSDRRLRDDGACHLPRQGGWPRRSQHGKQGRSPTRHGVR